MAPRRGGGSYWGGYGDYNPWSETILLSVKRSGRYYGDNYEELFYAQFAFDLLCLIAFAVFLIWASRFRSQGLPLPSIISALVCFILYEILVVIYEGLVVAETLVTYYYLIISMLWELFVVVAIAITFHIFWSFIHRFLARLSDSGRPSSAVAAVHWIFFSIIFVVGLAEFALTVVTYVYMVNPGAGDIYSMANAGARLGAALKIIYWLMSMEILAWLAFIFVKSGRLMSKTPVITLIAGAVSWFAVCFGWAVVQIHYTLLVNPAPTYLSFAQSVIQLIFWIGTFTGILLCCGKWRTLGDAHEKHSVPQGPVSQYPSQYPHQDQAQYPAPYPEGQYAPAPQPYATAPYQDYSAQSAQQQIPSPR
ncbi:uncharacterized protein N7515_010089 [Penicillium bovifimosum]|uniref:Uncharacterized protein n=1 Tax=Penicillium bovifimosum TaxID=126998 RepID=A0A9W9GI64_9EURO|nr:uncharacterized protein N7515_010089 [Penicillium bovifimosum]KAJ5120701.1 hypothetical protein N7515_010089 [Penicillium bovifimosum]